MGSAIWSLTTVFVTGRFLWLWLTLLLRPPLGSAALVPLSWEAEFVFYLAPTQVLAELVSTAAHIPTWLVKLNPILIMRTLHDCQFLWRKLPQLAPLLSQIGILFASHQQSLAKRRSWRCGCSPFGGRQRGQRGPPHSEGMVGDRGWELLVCQVPGYVYTLALVSYAVSWSLPERKLREGRDFCQLSPLP